MSLEASPALCGVGFRNTEGVSIVYLIGSKVNEVDEITKMVKKHGVLCGYNIKKYDSIILSYIMNNHGASAHDIFEFSQNIKKVLNDHSHNSSEDYRTYKNKTYRIGYVDLQKVNDLKSENLLKTAISINFENVTHLNTDKLNMSESFKGHLKEFIERKVEIIHSLYNKSLERLKIRKYLSKEYNEDLMCSTNSTVASMILQKKYTAKTGISKWDLYKSRQEYSFIELKDILPYHLKFKNKSITDLFERLKSVTLSENNSKIDEQVITKSIVHNFKRGGLHSVSKPGIIKPPDGGKLIYLDFNTFYGKLIIQQDIRPNHVSERFLEVIKDLIELRTKLKNNDNPAHNMIKRTIASISGNLSAKKSMFRDFKAAVKLYMFGQFTLLKVIDNVELVDGVECIYSNTDGIILKAEESSLKGLKIALNQTSEELGIPWETKLLDRLIYLDVNNYAITGIDNEFDGVGLFNNEVKIGDALRAPIVTKAINNYFIEDIPVEKTVIDGRDDINNYTYSSSIESDSVASYETQHESIALSRENRYYVSQSFGNIVHRKMNSKHWKPLITGYHCRPINKVEDKKYRKINFKYYIMKANKVIDKIDDKQLTLF